MFIDGDELAERVRKNHAPTRTVGYRPCSDPECPRHRQRHRHRYVYMACAWGCGVVRSTESGECDPYRLASAVINSGVSLDPPPSEPEPYDGRMAL